MPNSASRVVVVDYGLGNLGSVARALRHVGADPVVTSNPNELLAAPRAVLPGVGAFGTAMDNLESQGWIGPLKAFAASGRPIFGVCLGMQLFMDESEEGGRRGGLALIPGRVARLPTQPRFKVPHIGWSALEQPSASESGVLAGLGARASLYFVHSYYVAPADARYVLAWTTYGTCRYGAVIRRGNVIGCQAHPEKSSRPGLKMLENFLAVPIH